MSTAIAPLEREVPVLPGSGLRTLYAFRKDPLPMFAAARDLGDVVRLRVPLHDVFAVTSPEASQRLLSGSPEVVYKGTRGARILARTLGPGLLTTDGAVWVARRRAAQPHFRKEAMGTWVAVVKRHAEALADEWLATDGPVDVVATANRTALRIVCEAMLGVTLGDDDDVVARSLDTVLAGFLWMTTFPIDGVDRWPLPASIRHRRAVAALRGVVDRIVARRREGEARQGAASKSSAFDDPNGLARSPEGRSSDAEDAGRKPPTSRQGEEAQDDVLGAWIAARDRGELDDDDLRAEVLTLLLAGHETTANAVAWTLGLLAREPEALAAVVADVDAGQTRLVDAAVNEGMRLYPPAWIVARAVKEPVDLGPATLPTGAYAFVPIAAIHRDPRHWPEPDAFRLDRWERAPAKGTYLPFGAGPRRCIGEHFARLEAREVVAAVLARAAIAPVGELPAAEPTITLRPRGGLRLRVTAR